MTEVVMISSIPEEANELKKESIRRGSKKGTEAMMKKCQ
jgi:hypothetical protein